METIELTLPPLHKAQREVAEHPARFKVLACGRRWGKTRLASAQCLAEAMRGGRAWWVAPTYPVATVGFRIIRALSVQIPGSREELSSRTVYLPSGGSIQVRSADNPDSLRGEGLDYLVMDECAFIKESAWAEALRPALADRRGRGMFISTPKGRNWFWRMWSSADGVEVANWRFTTFDNPYIERDEIEATRRSMSDRYYRQEIMAEFIEDTGGVFRGVDKAATIPETIPPEPGQYYTFGVDWAKHDDFNAIVILDSTGRMVHLDRTNHIDYHVQLGRLKSMMQEYPPAVVVAERNAMGEPLVEQLELMGVPIRPFLTTNASKQLIIDQLSVAIERGDIQLMQDEDLLTELKAFEGTRLPSGRLRYAAPEGLHDDTVLALAMAWDGMADTGDLLLW